MVMHHAEEKITLSFHKESKHVLIQLVISANNAIWCLGTLVFWNQGSWRHLNGVTHNRGIKYKRESY